MSSYNNRMFRSIAQLLLVAILCPLLVKAQFTQTGYETDRITNANGLQYGASLKLTVEMIAAKWRSTLGPGEPRFFLRLAVSGGVSSNFTGPWVHPSVNTEFDFYNGGIGAGDRHPGKMMCDWIIAFTATGGFMNKDYYSNNNYDPARNIPLYYFSDNVLPSLQNPFDGSLSLGTNIVKNLNKRGRRPQRVGFLNAHYKGFQLSYYNDGAIPFAQLWLGDKEDRYYTGGLAITYNLPTTYAVNQFGFGYKKFTGYTKSSFDAATKLRLATVSYKKESEQYFNKSVWSVNAANIRTGYSGQVSFYNSIGSDLQHLIHWSKFDAYHMVPYRAIMTLAGGYMYNYNTTSFK